MHGSILLATALPALHNTPSTLPAHYWYSQVQCQYTPSTLHPQYSTPKVHSRHTRSTLRRGQVHCQHRPVLDKYTPGHSQVHCKRVPEHSPRTFSVSSQHITFQHTASTAKVTRNILLASCRCLRVLACTFVRPAEFCGLLRVLSCTWVFHGNVNTHGLFVKQLCFIQAWFHRVSRPTCQAKRTDTHNTKNQLNKQNKKADKTKQNKTKQNKQASNRASKPNKPNQSTNQPNKQTSKQTKKPTNQ